MIIEPQINKLQIITIIVLFVAVSFILTSIINYYFYYWIPLSMLIILWMMIILIRFIANYLLFPGSFQLTRSYIENRQSQYWQDNLKKTLSILSDTFSDISANLANRKEIQIFNMINLINSLKDTIDILNKGNKTPNRIQLSIQLQQLLSNITKNIKLQNNTTNFVQLLNGQHQITEQFSQKQEQIIKLKVQQCLSHIDQINQIIQQFSPYNSVFQSDHFKQPSYEHLPARSFFYDTFKSAKWFLNAQKLFQLDSYYAHWDKAYEYSHIMILTTDGYQLETAIIHKFANKISKNKFKNRKAVILSQPNAVYLQSFAINSQYIDMYLDLGYEIILWNYRGYGNSTGVASLTKNMLDINEVYCYYKKYEQIDIVISHGYSIGATCAISLAEKYSEEIKLLIADRTFSDLVSTVLGFLKDREQWHFNLLKRLTKYILWFFMNSEMIDFAQLYAQTKTKKVIILSTIDQIIKQSASLRNGLYKFIQNQCQDGVIIDESVNQQKNNDNDDISTLISDQIPLQNQKQANIVRYAQIFAQSMDVIYTFSNQIAHIICKELRDIDGGGILTNKIFTRKMQRVQSLNTLKYYLLGLALFGPKRSNIQQKQIPLILDQLKGLENQGDVKISRNIKNVLKSLNIAYKHLASKKYYNRYGNIIVTDHGHNGPIGNRKIVQLKSHISNQICM